jgi:hypothetical protein
MQGVTTALVAFIFFCVIFPERVKSAPQFYAGLALVCLIILLDALGFMIASSAFRVFAYFTVACLQVGTILLLFLAAGGISWRELGAEMKGAFEVIRRGGEEKEVIIPLTGQQPRRKEQDDAPAERIDLTPPTGAPDQPRQDSRLPLE